MRASAVLPSVMSSSYVSLVFVVGYCMHVITGIICTIDTVPHRAHLPAHFVAEQRKTIKPANTVRKASEYCSKTQAKCVYEKSANTVQVLYFSKIGTA